MPRKVQKRPVRQTAISGIDPDNWPHYFLSGHDWFGEIERAKLTREQLQEIWQQHKEELLKLWHATRGTWETDPLFFDEHGPDIPCWAELNLE